MPSIMVPTHPIFLEHITPKCKLNFPDQAHNFQRENASLLGNFPYDYKSVMHYANNDFSPDGRQNIYTAVPGLFIHLNSEIIAAVKCTFFQHGKIHRSTTRSDQMRHCQNQCFIRLPAGILRNTMRYKLG